MSISRDFGEDVDPEIIDLFNKRFKTNYLAPVTYNFRKDYKIAEKINTLRPLINFADNKNYKYSNIMY